jgi:hypothetical protein
MTKKFKDFYGCTATITDQTDGKVRLIMKTASGRTIIRKSYTTYKGARSAMSRSSDGWNEIA